MDIPDGDSIYAGGLVIADMAMAANSRILEFSR
jgi:hypothetical protein